MISLIRGIIKAARMANAKGPLRIDASGRIGEEFTDKQMFQQFGFSSMPKDGAECLLVKSGQNVIIIASDDRRYKIDLSSGEAALHDAYGNVVHLQDSGNILVKAGGSSGKIFIEAAGEVSVKAKKAVIDSDNVFLGGEAAAELGGGVVTQMCICSFTGNPHPAASSKVKAAL
ncbi:MAG: phage baseplate assembly protein [Chitinispirillia bacterium]|nr:phage baseplate assembly protein [Chitinispirillia bacterium]